MLKANLETLVAFEAIRQTKGKYQYYIDSKQWDMWRELFTEDLRWFDGDGAAREGREDFIEMTRSYIDKVHTVHQVHAPVIELLSPTTASGIWPMFDYVDLPGAAFQGYGYYHETYRIESGEWKISSLLLSRIRTDDVEGSNTTTYFDLSTMTQATNELPRLA